MAWFKEDSIFSFGKYKGKKVEEVNDKKYIEWLHYSSYNVYFYQDMLDKLGIVNRGKVRNNVGINKTSR